MTNTENREIEVRFLEIDKDALIQRVKTLGGIDQGEKMLEEIICKIGDNPTKGQFVRLRDNGEKLMMSYKNHAQNTNHQLNNVEEIEVELKTDINNIIAFLERVGVIADRFQQKLRHTLELEGVTIDIDTWPKLPPYVELEAESEERLKEMALKLGLDWGKVVFENARSVIENTYSIPLGTLKYFTFDRYE